MSRHDAEPPHQPGAGLDRIDLNQLAQQNRLSLELKSPESAEDAAARRQREAAEAAHRRRIFRAVFSVLVAVAIVCVPVVLADHDTTARTSAYTILVAIISGFVGYGSASLGKQG